MTLQIAEDLEALLSTGQRPAESVVRELIVLEIYRQHRISSGKAAQLLAESREEFLNRAANAGIPYLDLTPAELEDEFQASEQLARAHNL
jgi:predicted HTH domain antitoxin